MRCRFIGTSSIACWAHASVADHTASAAPGAPGLCSRPASPSGLPQRLTSGASHSSASAAAAAAAESASSQKAGTYCTRWAWGTANCSAVTMAGAVPPSAQPVLYPRLNPAVAGWGRGGGWVGGAGRSAPPRGVGPVAALGCKGGAGTAQRGTPRGSAGGRVLCGACMLDAPGRKSRAPARGRGDPGGAHLWSASPRGRRIQRPTRGRPAQSRPSPAPRSASPMRPPPSGGPSPRSRPRRTRSPAAPRRRTPAGRARASRPSLPAGWRRTLPPATWTPCRTTTAASSDPTHAAARAPTRTQHRAGTPASTQRPRPSTTPASAAAAAAPAARASPPPPRRRRRRSRRRSLSRSRPWPLCAPAASVSLRSRSCSRLVLRQSSLSRMCSRSSSAVPTMGRAHRKGTRQPHRSIWSGGVRAARRRGVGGGGQGWGREAAAQSRERSGSRAAPAPSPATRRLRHTFGASDSRRPLRSVQPRMPRPHPLR